MSNTYFRFKHFIIHQDQCVMKVCTDSCLLGAWSARHVTGAKRILDIGTGTGLLSLMLAQKSDALIDAIEWDPESCAQARENMRSSAWSGRLQLIEGDVRVHPFPDLYNHIIVNPPFFELHLKSPEIRKNKARHEASLTLDELVAVIKKYLQPDGSFSILLPYHRDAYFETLAVANGFFLREKLIVTQTPIHSPFRSISLFTCQKPEQHMISEISIKDQSGKNSVEFQKLMENYYL